jgi:hypothetical protein
MQKEMKEIVEKQNVKALDAKAINSFENNPLEPKVKALEQDLKKLQMDGI